MAGNLAQNYYDRIKSTAQDIQEQYGFDPWTDKKRELRQNADNYGNYFTNGSFSAQGNDNQRTQANKYITDLDNEMSRYGKSTQQYKTLSSYRDYYQDSLNKLDRLDVVARASDYVGADAWHSQEDYDLYRQSLVGDIDLIQGEMDKIEDKNSADYNALKEYYDWYNSCLEAVDARHENDALYQDADDYVRAQRAVQGDYKYSADLRTTKAEIEQRLADLGVSEDLLDNRDSKVRELESEMAKKKEEGASDKELAKIQKQIDKLNASESPLQTKIRSLESQLFDLQAVGADEQTLSNLQGQIDALREAEQDLQNLQAVNHDLDRAQYWQDAVIWANYGGYDKNYDYEKKVKELDAARELTEEGSPEREKIDAQLRVLAGVNGDGTGADGLYDASTALGRQVLANFNVEEGEKELAVMDKILDLYKKEEQLRTEINRMAQGNVASEEMLSKDEQIAQVQKELDGITAQREALQKEHADYDVDEIALRGMRTGLNRKVMSAGNLQAENHINESIAKLSEEERTALIEEGKKWVEQMEGTSYVTTNHNLVNLKNLKDLDDDMGGEIRDAIYTAIGADRLGKDIGYTIEDAGKTFEGQINQIAGYKLAKKIDSYNSDVGRWLAQVPGMATQAGLNQFAQGVKQVFSDEQVTPNKIAAAGAYTRANLGERYGKGNFLGTGSNFSQVLFDTTQTTANMLPMIAMSYLTSGVLGAVGVAAGTASTAGQLAGAGLMGLSSGGNSYQQALAEGWKKEDAKKFALIMGAAEAGMQYLIGGISGLGGVTEEGILNAAKGINNAAVRWATETGVHILSETTEELAQNRLERYLTYNLFGQGDSDWLSWTDDDWYTVIVTALSTGAMEGPGAAINIGRETELGKLASGEKTLSEKQLKKLQSAKIMKAQAEQKRVAAGIGKYMKSSEALTETLKIIGTDIMPEDSDAHKLATKMSKNKNAPSDLALGTLFELVMNEDIEGDTKEDRLAAYDKRMAQVIGGAVKYNENKRLTDAKAAEDAKVAEVKANNPGAQVLDSNASKIANNGVDYTDALQISPLVNKVLSGTQLSKAEMTELTSNTPAAKAARAVLSESNSTLTADMDHEVAESVIRSMTTDMAAQAKQRQAQNRASVVQAAMDAAAKAQVNRATAKATIEGAMWSENMRSGSIVEYAAKGQPNVNYQQTRGLAQERVGVNDVKALQQANASAQTINQQIEAIQSMSLEELGNLAVVTPEGVNASDWGSFVKLTAQRAQLQEQVNELSKTKVPTRAQRDALVSARSDLAKVEQQLKSVVDRIKAATGEKTAKQSAAKKATIPAKAKGEAAQSSSDTVTLPSGQVITRAEFEGTDEEFNEMAAMTGQKGNVNEQAANNDQGRNALGERGNGEESAERGAQPGSAGEPGGNVGVNELRTRPGENGETYRVADVSEKATVTESDNEESMEALRSKYEGIDDFTDYLKESGFERVTYVTGGAIFNDLGQSVPAVYNNRELVLRLDYNQYGYSYEDTAEHERMHLRLDLVRAHIGETDTRALVSTTLQAVLTEQGYVDAFAKYAERYAPLYMVPGATVENVGHMINEEMLCDMMGGLNNFGVDLGTHQMEANDYLEAAHFNVVAQNLADNPDLNPGTLVIEDIDENAMPYNAPVGTLLSDKNVDNPSTAPANPAQISKFAFFGLAEALGFRVDKTNPKSKIYYLNDEDARLGRNGFTQVTVDMIRQSPIGALIEYSFDKGNISEDEMKQELNLFASIASITDQTHDFYQAMQFMGSTIFTAMKANSDKQYGTTYDFPSICTKTQAIINEMSAQMVAKGRSLTEDEIEKAYNDVFNDGNPVPCPECYVFSRWVGIGGLLDNIKAYQERFGKMSVDEVIAEYNRVNAEVEEFAKENGLSKGRAKGSLAKVLDKQFKDLEEKIQKNENQGVAVPASDYKKLDALKSRMSTIRSLTWIDDVYFAGKAHTAANVNKRFSVPNNVLFDLNEGETFARDYAEAWAFRTTQGAGYGKAITPYAEAILGEGMMVTTNTSKTIKAKAEAARKGSEMNNPYLTEKGKITEKSARGKNLTSAIKKQLNQLFIGGQRLQSTSDARFDNAVDYLLAALELQSMEAGAQVYTKVPGAVAFFNACKMCTNMSLMPKGGGLDAKGNPIDTSVGGMNVETAMMLRKLYEYAGTITIGVNDAHIRAMLGQVYRDFIIPYHASGGKMSLIEYFRQVQDPDLKGTTIKSSDYTKTQADRIIPDSLLASEFGKSKTEIEDIHKFRDTRLYILTGGKSGAYHSEILNTSEEGLTPSQINARKILQQMYASMQKGGKWEGVQLAKGKVEHQIFPNEFWDTSSTHETSSVNTQRYLDYCEALGFLHRFSGKTISFNRKTQTYSLNTVSGYNEKGEKVDLTDLAYKNGKDGEIEPFFWKTLTDRRMYGNEGQYLEQPHVDLTNLKAETVATFAAPMGERRYNHKVSMQNSAARANVSKFSIQEEIPVDDVHDVGGNLVVEIDSEKSGLNNYPRNEWRKILRDQIRAELVGKTILTVDGDLISFMDLSSREPVYGKAIRRQRDLAMETGDFSKVDRKQLAVEHIASLVSTSTFGRWDANRDEGDLFKRDGLNHRDAMIKIDGQYYDVDIATALNTDPTDVDNYGDKFYDIRISEVPSTKTRGVLSDRAVPHTIKFVENTSDKLSVAQKDRAVKNAGVTFTAQGKNSGSAMANAFANPGRIRTKSPSRYALSNLDYEVTPSSNGWQRDHTTDEVKAMYPGLWDITADESETRNPTQVRDTVKTYRKIYDILKAEGFKGTILDASSGLGDGTKAGRDEYGFNVEDIEPFPDKSYSPTYTDYDSLNKKYDAIISNAVLNVLPQDQRDALVVKMGNLLKDSGKMFINVRGDDVRGNKSNQPVGGKWEYYVASTGSYQKGFTSSELVSYLKDALGPGFTVEPTKQFGKTAVVVTKNGAPTQTRPVIPAKNALVTPAAESRYSVQNNTLTNTGSNSTIDETAQQNYDRLKGAIENVLSNNNGQRNASDSAWKDAERIEKLYRADSVTGGENRAAVVDAIRKAGGVRNLRTTDSWGSRITTSAIDPSFYTKEMLLTEKANKEHALDTVFFTGAFILDGDVLDIAGASGPDPIVYINASTVGGLNSALTKEESIKDGFVEVAKTVTDSPVNLIGRHERFHALKTQRDQSVLDMERMVLNDTSFDPINKWYQTNLHDPDFNRFVEETAAELYAGGIKMSNQSLQRMVDNYVDRIDNGTQHGPMFSVQNENSLENDILNILSTSDPETLSAWVNDAMANHEDALENAKIKAPAIPSKGFVPRVTAEERGALNRMLQQQLRQYGQQKPSEKSNGFVIPAKRAEGQNYRRFYQNVGSYEALPQDARDLTLRQLMTSTASTYVPDSDAKLIKGAEDQVKDMGYEHSVAAFKHDAKNLKLGTKDMLKTIALGEQLIVDAAAQGDAANLIEVTAYVAELGTTIGKSLQAFRLLKQMGPIGQLSYVQKAVDRINKQNEERIKRGKATEIVADPELCKAVVNARTAEDRDKAMDALIKDLAKQAPKTLADRWNAWRYLAMLGNVRTHVRNIIGNAVFAPLRYMKDVMASGGELLATKAGWMEEADRTKALSVSRELRDFALKDADVMQKELQGNGKYNPAREILQARQLLPGFLDTLSRFNGNALEMEDWWFLKPAYARALSQQLSHSGYSIEEMQSTVEGQKFLNEARKNAIQEAQKATYRDFSSVASWLNKGKQMQGAGRIVAIGLEGVLPFTKTPINILKRGMEYSPIGIAKGIGQILNGIRDGNLDVAEAIDTLCAGLTGTGIAALGWLLARMGILRGKKGDDDEENFDKLRGAQDYSIQIGNQSFTIDWAAPTALPLFTGAAISDLMDEDHELSWGDAWNAVMMIAEPMTSLSMLDGLNKLLDSTSYASGNEKIATIASQAATSYLGQAFPTILGQVARTIDGTRRSTYVDKNSAIPAAAQRFVQSSVQSKVPGWESSKVPYIDAWGRQSEAGSVVLNGIENFFMPYYRSVKNVTDVDEEIDQLYKSTKADILPSVPQKYFSVNGEKKNLTADEWVSYATDVGQTKYELLTQLFSDRRYLALTDDQKAKAIKDYIYKYATAAGKYHVDQNFNIHNAGVWIEEAEAARTSTERFERIWEQIEKGLKD